ncbi:GNAT family N-acetyltransferase [Radiobacillus deserti]|uniref:N-acetyltransferase n=1 Tax=Radiobacillus deserti TaxID=2594883 RepID=A0A516KDT8_9BACI|nr:GNAT family N-acetyltransferase [Radiobacillus deserti]QDP39574.1 N-acetyltransferase [Radiobacillus deserti]
MVIVRDAHVNDVPEMTDIYNNAVRTTTATFDLEEQTADERQMWFHSFNDQYPLIVAEFNGHVVGYCSLSPYRSKPAYAKTVELSVYIAPNHRGNGVGSILLEEIIKRAKKLGYHTILGGVTEGNKRSMRLHEKFGFENVGCLKEVGFKFGNWQDVHFYQLILK